VINSGNRLDRLKGWVTISLIQGATVSPVPNEVTLNWKAEVEILAVWICSNRLDYHEIGCHALTPTLATNARTRPTGFLPVPLQSGQRIACFTYPQAYMVDSLISIAHGWPSQVLHLGRVWLGISSAS
jgi:hypothetical protein